MKTEAIDLEGLGALAKEAGAAILSVYQKRDLAVEEKDDRTPLTEADRASHEIIASALRARYPEIPCISEEGKGVAYEERTGWERFWLVDPLDGTKEFIRGEPDFTVNIALVEEGLAVLGVVYAPVRDWLYLGRRVPASAAEAARGIKAGDDGAAMAYGAWKECKGQRVRLPMPALDAADGRCVAVRSKSHPQPEEAAVLERLGVTETVSMGSSLKFCLVAEGAADIYYRAGPTWEWDTAAAHAVVAAAGGIVLHGEAELRYNKPTLKNDHGFLCLLDPSRAAAMKGGGEPDPEA